MRASCRWNGYLALGFLVLCSSISGARADSLFSVTNLGPASPGSSFYLNYNLSDPTGNYLDALSRADQAAFRSGSFDVYAHPATGWSTTGMNPDLSQLGYDVVRDSMVTGNNLGEYAGTATFASPSWPSTEPGVALYYPDPHPEPSLGPIHPYRPAPNTRVIFRPST
jgi:hypothetical protein